MIDRTKIVLGGLISLLIAGHPTDSMAALTGLIPAGSVRVEKNVSFGNCKVALTAKNLEASVKLKTASETNTAGGTEYQPNGDYSAAVFATSSGGSITTAAIASCLGIESSIVTDLKQNGAESGSDPNNDQFMGFQFSLSKGIGGLDAGTYEYSLGTTPGDWTQNATKDFEIKEAISTNAESSSEEPLRAQASKIQTNAVRQQASQIAGNQKLVREGRTRFIQSRRQMSGDSAGISSRNTVDFEFDGTLNATNGYISSQGSFFQQDGSFEGTSRRVLFGDFDIQRSSDSGSTTATLTGKMAWERLLDEQNMIGYYVGADVARSNIKGTYTGEQDTYGVSVGTYFVSALQENLFLDGFVSLGVGKNDLTLADGTVDLNGDFTSRSVTLGTALTGVIKQEGYEIWPELAFTYGKTRLGTIGMTDRLAAVANNSVTVDAGDVSIANLTLRPEYRMPMDGLASVDSLSLFTFAPRLLCEQVETTAKSKNCGGGAEFGIDRTSEDGRSRFVARIKADRIAKVTRSALELKFEHRF